MADETKRALRRAWFQVHKWLGLALLILFIPLSLSGSALVWHDALDRVIAPGRYAISGHALLPPSRYVAAAQPVLAPGDCIVSIRFDADGPVQVSAAPAHAPRRPGPPPRTNVWLDPPSARVLDHGPNSAGLVRLIHGFHGMLLIPGIGRAIVGWLGVAMFLSCLSGLWLWWPAAGRLVRALRWSRGDRRFDTNLHHLVGFWIVLPLAMLSFTGAWIAWPQMVGAGGMARRMPPPPATRVLLDPDAVLAAARALRPGPPASLAWPTAGGPWRVSLGDEDRAVDLAVDDTLPALARPAPPAGARGPGGPAPLYRRLHEGTGMGPVWQTLIFLAGIAPAILGITGITMWLRSRRWRKPLRAVR